MMRGSEEGDPCGCPIQSRDGYMRSCRRKATTPIPEHWGKKVERWACSRHADKEMERIFGGLDPRLGWAIRRAVGKGA